MLVEDANPDDATACAAIYAPYVRDTAVSFELDAPDADELARRIAQARAFHAWVVAREDGRVVGYAYGSSHKPRPAYRWACEVSVYVAPDRHRTGVARGLYSALFDRLAERGYRTLVAATTLPNPASEVLHRALGFESIGVWRRIGWKRNSWHDVALFQLSIGDEADPPVGPR